VRWHDGIAISILRAMRGLQLITHKQQFTTINIYIYIYIQTKITERVQRKKPRNRVIEELKIEENKLIAHIVSSHGQAGQWTHDALGKSNLSPFVSDSQTQSLLRVVALPLGITVL
jgi:hypothetical protein